MTVNTEKFKFSGSFQLDPLCTPIHCWLWNAVTASSNQIYRFKRKTRSYSGIGRNHLCSLTYWWRCYRWVLTNSSFIYILYTNIDKLNCLKRLGRFLEPTDVIHLLMVIVLAVHKMWTISLPPALVRSAFFVSLLCNKTIESMGSWGRFVFSFKVFLPTSCLVIAFVIIVLYYWWIIAVTLRDKLKIKDEDNVRVTTIAVMWMTWELI